MGDRIRGRGRWISEETATIVYNSSKLALNPHSSTTHELMDLEGDFINPRTFALAATGCFQLVDYRPPLEELFEVGSEVVVYRSLEELRELIDHYLANPDESEQIAQRARERALKDHTYERRMERILEIVRPDGDKA